MTLTTSLATHDVVLSPTEQKRIRRYLGALERRLEHHPEPSATLMLKGHAAARRVTVDLRVQLGPLGEHLVSHQAAESATQAVRLAVEDIERQLDRRHASERGEPTYGVPSRRLPETLRPHPPGPVAPEEPAEEEEKQEE